MAGSPEERILAGEMLLVMTLETIDALSGAQSGKVKLPNPARYVSTMAVFLMLAAATMFGPGPAKIAARFGGLATLAILLAPTKNPTTGALTGDPIALSFIKYIGQITGGGVLGPSAATTDNTFNATAGSQGASIIQGGAAALGQSGTPSTQQASTGAPVVNFQ